MMVPGLPEDHAIKAWLDGLEPAWRLLDHANLRALRRQPSPAGPIRLATDMTPSEIQQSAVTRNTLSLLGAAAAKSGLKLTATGNLARGEVAEMLDLFDWPDFPKEELLSVSKVVNEPDFAPLYYVRHLALAARLLRKHKGLIKVTKTGRRCLEEPDQRALQAVLFHVAFWYLDLGYFSRTPLGTWPQHDAGIVLWSLSVAAEWLAIATAPDAPLHDPDPTCARGPWGPRRMGDGGEHPAPAALIRAPGTSRGGDRAPVDQAALLSQEPALRSLPDLRRDARGGRRYASLSDCEGGAIGNHTQATPAV